MKKKGRKYRLRPWVKHTLLGIFIIISFVAGYRTSRNIHAIGINAQQDIQIVNSVIGQSEEVELAEPMVLTEPTELVVENSETKTKLTFEREINVPEPVVEETTEASVEETPEEAPVVAASNEAVSGVVEEPEATQNNFGYTEDEMNLIYAIVRQEGGPSYDSALAVISSAINRTNSPKWSYLGSTVLDQLTAPNQYCYSIDSYWKQYLNGNVEDEVKEAVQDGLSGVTSHNWTCFRGYPVDGATNIGGNYYFGD